MSRSDTRLKTLSLLTRPSGAYIARMDKDQVAEVLVSIGTLLELKGENPFKTRAYLNAARTIETLSEPLDKARRRRAAGRNQRHRRGAAEENHRTGHDRQAGVLRGIEGVRSRPGCWRCSTSPGWARRRSRRCTTSWASRSVEQLEQACKDGKVAGLKGFGEKTQTNILEGIQRRRAYASQTSDRATRCSLAEPLLEASALASRRDPLQRGRQPAAASGGHRRH